MLGVGTTGAMVGEGASPGTSLGPSDVRPSDGPSAGERDAWAILASIDGLGPVTFTALLTRFGSARAVLTDAARPGAVARLVATPGLQPEPEDARRHREHPVLEAVARTIVEATQTGVRTLERLHALEVRALTIEEPGYPARLRGIAMPPHVLFTQGEPRALAHRRAVAVVGTRRATLGGRHSAARIATALVAADAAVISGLAVGIDGVAHEAAIRAEGTTVAVIGGGHGRLSPPGHRRLADAIVRSGGAVVSEHGPDLDPTPGTFPRRNRIISGLSEATVVIQAPARSGALITASWALEQGRPAFLVPGALGDPAAAGCLAFLREFADEARIVSGIPELIADLGFIDPAGATGPSSSDRVATAALQELGRTESQVARALLAGHVTVDSIVAVTDLPVASVLATLSLLGGRRLVVEAHGRYVPAGALLGEVRLPVAR